jgi:chromosome transmission fidelity protein 1
LTELGSVLGSMIGLIPDGVVVFLPSYAFLEKVKAFWAKSGLMAKLGERKQVSCESLDEDHSQYSGILRTTNFKRCRDGSPGLWGCDLIGMSIHYHGAHDQSQAASQNGEKSRKNGALLFAVVGGKLSEGEY